MFKILGHVVRSLHVGDNGQRYGIAVLDYVTRYAVASTVETHEAKNVAVFLVKNIVLKFGPFR
ncbi:LOW QUALITY PROTEIN: hypothetical protein PHMEG_00038873 [Phytophthora megakarya]|uniref:Uncharacterized protein n=1 Tax=Phytophthora megakarya TaxID=4795 RepID=A0A225UJA2_9STRA|nr:LOW QUALITY PROTEIN: hypothetical protein PHMEG_00038873 [Phytophthora megakarya]